VEPLVSSLAYGTAPGPVPLAATALTLYYFDLELERLH
jgi:hypothetical protein